MQVSACSLCCHVILRLLLIASDCMHAGERVLVYCHVILHPKACGGGTMVWDYPEALAAIASDEAGGCVQAR